jgi:hypothetical protein
MSEPRFNHDAARKRYQLLLGDQELGFIDYDPVGAMRRS